MKEKQTGSVLKPKKETIPCPLLCLLLGVTPRPKIWIEAAPGHQSKVNIKASDSTFADRAWGTFGRWSSPANLDPITIFEPDQDGDYVLGIADEQRLYGPNYVYRVEIEPVKNQIQFCITHDYRESSKRDALVVPIGNRTERTWRKIRVPGNNYSGEYDIVAEGLPPGVKFIAPTLKEGDQMVQVQVEASPDAKPWAGFIDIRLVPRKPDQTLEGGYVLNAAAEAARGGYIDSFMPTRRCT